MKKTLVSIIAVLLIFIPTYIAIANYIATNNAPISNKYVEKIKITDIAKPESNSYELTKKNNADAISTIIAMNENATEISEIPDPLSGEAFYIITFYSGSVAEECKYYLEIDGSQSYYVDAKGQGYKLRNEDVLNFLKTPYANSLYAENNDVEMPFLYTASGAQMIIPSSVEWNYSADGETVIPVTGFKTTSDILSYKMEGGISLDFKVDADNYDVVVLDKDSNEIFKKEALTDLSEIDLGASTQVTFLITAHWFEDAAREYNGKATYNFKAELLAGAEFYIAGSEIDKGEFVTITGYNVSDPSRIEFKSEPEIGYTPKFYKDGEKVVALVPIASELEGKSFKFTLSYGSVSQPINIDIGTRSFRRRTHSISEIIVKNTRSEEALAEFDRVFNEICSKSEETKYFDGKFIDYEPGDGIGLATIVCGYGHTRVISSTNDEYKNIGIDFKCAKGTKIPACNNGKVVYNDTTIFGGRMVVIDHGFGLKTWYMHLDTVDVNVGDIVKTNDIIGTAGKTGFTETNGVYTIMTVENIPVSPYGAWSEGVVIHSK